MGLVVNRWDKVRKNTHFEVKNRLVTFQALFWLWLALFGIVVQYRLIWCALRSPGHIVHLRVRWSRSGS